jgi:hypothetical protein
MFQQVTPLDLSTPYAALMIFARCFPSNDPRMQHKIIKGGAVGCLSRESYLPKEALDDLQSRRPEGTSATLAQIAKSLAMHFISYMRYPQSRVKSI